MRITYRSHDVKNYWADRWANIPADSAMTNEDVYPLKYALQTVKHKNGHILEAGCGAGRILRYFHDRGYDIHVAQGVDFEGARGLIVGVVLARRRLAKIY